MATSTSTRADEHTLTENARNFIIVYARCMGEQPDCPASYDEAKLTALATKMVCAIASPRDDVNVSPAMRKAAKTFMPHVTREKIFAFIRS